MGTPLRLTSEVLYPLKGSHFDLWQLLLAMKISLKPLSQQTIVITGASSGIGLATAYQAAEASAQVVLAARNEEALQQIAAEIKSKGGTAIRS